MRDLPQGEAKNSLEIGEGRFQDKRQAPGRESNHADLVTSEKLQDRFLSEDEMIASEYLREDLDQHCPVELPVKTDMFYICTVQHRSH